MSSIKPPEDVVVMSPTTPPTTTEGFSPGAEPSTRKTGEQRKELLARQITNSVAQGRRVESQSDFQAVLVKGKPVSHVLHLILTLVTLGAWLVVWVPLAILGGEKREIASVDEWGSTTLQSV
jgi:hypothetical protein